MRELKKAIATSPELCELIKEATFLGVAFITPAERVSEEKRRKVLRAYGRPCSDVDSLVNILKDKIARAKVPGSATVH